MSDALRILLFTRTFTEPDSATNWGGVQVHEFKLCEALVAQGHHVTLLASYAPPAAYDGLRLELASVPHGSRILGRRRTKRARKAIVDLVRQRSIDVVYFSEVPRVYGAICRHLGEAGVPFAVAVHNHRAQHVETAHGIAKRRERLGVEYVSRVITPSDWLRDELAPVIGDLGTTVHPGVDPALDDWATPERVHEARQRLGLDGRRAILCMGRFAARKRFDSVIRALPSLTRRFDDLVLLAVGDGEMKAAWQRLAEELGVDDRVRWIPHVENREVGVYYKLADVFALVSHPASPSDTEEAFALVKLEAGLCGTPVVGARIGGIPEGIVDGETGLLIPPQDGAALHDALARLLGDAELRRRLGANARARVLAHYNWDRVGTEIASVLQKSADR